MPDKITCLECGEVFFAAPSAKRKYCSNKCRARESSRSLMKDLTGQRFGRWTALHPSENRGKSGDTKWMCRCECGIEREVFTTSLTGGNTKSCGCLHREVAQNLGKANMKPLQKGTQFTRLAVIQREGTKRGHAAYHCRCECGAETIVTRADLVSGNTKSCGCYNIDQIRKRSTTHGLTGTPGFSSWRHQMRSEADSDWTAELSAALFEMMPECIVCGSAELLAMDHVHPVSKGGRAEPGNVVVLCKSCNSRKHNKLLSELPFEWELMIGYMAHQFLTECSPSV